jgi:glycosyltransferase involved in cell wall biosynthesis
VQKYMSVIKMIIITIPAYNEEKTIVGVISDIHRVMKGKKYKILVVDDGSNDKTAEISKKNRAIVVSHPHNMGLAAAFRTEMKKCLELGATQIVHIDSDGQYKAKDIPKLLDGLKDADLVLGSRFLGTIESMPLIKRLGNMAFSSVISHITRNKITDGQTGFRAFTKEVAETLQIRSELTYTQEQIIDAFEEGFRVKEVPVYFKKREGHSHLVKNPLNYASRAGIGILRTYRDYEPLGFFGTIGGAFLILGTGLGAKFTYLHFTIGIEGHIPLIVLMILLLIFGMQIMIFGFLADMKRRD